MKLIRGQEREHHRLAYYEYLDSRNLSEVSRRTKYSLRSINIWFLSFEWARRARLHDLEIQKKTEKKLIDDNVKRNLKQIKDLEGIEKIIDTLPKSLFEQDKKGHLLNEEGKDIETHGGQPVLKLSLDNIVDLERYVTLKMRIQDQRRRIEGEPDVLVKEESKTIITVRYEDDEK
jgi:hypothetical protein